MRAAIIRDPGLHVPRVLAYVTAAVFFMGAVAVLKQLRGVQSNVDGLAPLILIGLTAIGGWIALSPDSGGCTVSANDGPTLEVSGLGCRIPFGIGALFTGLMALYSGLAWLRARNRSGEPGSPAGVRYDEHTDEREAIAERGQVRRMIVFFIGLGALFGAVIGIVAALALPRDVVEQWFAQPFLALVLDMFVVTFVFVAAILALTMFCPPVRRYIEGDGPPLWRRGTRTPERHR